LAWQPSITGTYIEYENLINAYGKDVFEKDRYISDSTFDFRGKDVDVYIKRSKKEIIQMLIHADHVFSDGNISYEPTVNILLKNYYHSINNLYSDNHIYQDQKKEYKIQVDND